MHIYATTIPFCISTHPKLGPDLSTFCTCSLPPHIHSPWCLLCLHIHRSFHLHPPPHCFLHLPTNLLHSRRLYQPTFTYFHVLHEIVIVVPSSTVCILHQNLDVVFFLMSRLLPLSTLSFPHLSFLLFSIILASIDLMSVIRLSSSPIHQLFSPPNKVLTSSIHN